MAGQRRIMQGCFAREVARADVCASGQKQLHDLQAVMARGEVERRDAFLVDNMDVGALVEQPQHAVQTATGGVLVEGAPDWWVSVGYRTCPCLPLLLLWSSHREGVAVVVTWS